MSRIRTIKPDFFLNDSLADLPPLDRLLFIGLWTQADREGRLEDRPRKIKVAILPYDDHDISEALDRLQSKSFIGRYAVNGNNFIQINNFLKHQYPNIKEQESTIPAPYKHRTSTPLLRKGKEGKGKERKLKENILSEIDEEFKKFSSSKKAVETFLSVAASRNKTEAISVRRKLSLLCQLSDVLAAIGDESIFKDALLEVTGKDIDNINYLKKVIESKKKGGTGGKSQSDSGSSSQTPGKYAGIGTTIEAEN